MRIAHLLTASRSIRWQEGCACPGGVHAQEGVHAWGHAQGACIPGGACLGGVHATHAPLWTEFLTHTCENITFPQLLLRAVTNNNCC